MHISRFTLVATLSAAPHVLAQTYTDCNPLEKTCPNDTGLEAYIFSSDFTTGSSANVNWSPATGTTMVYGKNGAEFTIAKAGQAPTLQTDFYIFFGKIDVVMQAAPGTGIVSSIVLESDDLDEIDWEFLGGDTTQVETNYFGKGNTSTYDRAIYYPVSSPQTTFHTYTVDWTSSYVKFAVDGAVVRTINYADANGGSNFPQTPMRLKLGNWAGGAAGQPAGTVEWAGGATDFSQAPFTMYVKSISVQNHNPAAEYQWTDKTGSFKSIKVIAGDGTSATAANETETTIVKPTISNNKTLAPTSSHVVKAVQQTEAAVSSIASGPGPLTTVATMMSSSLPKSSGKNSSSVVSSTTLKSASSALGGSNSSAISASSLSSTRSHNTTSATGSATQSTSIAQQTTSGAASSGIATAIVALGSIAFAFMLL